MVLVSVGRIQLDDNLPCLQKTVFSWAVFGMAKDNRTQKATNLCTSAEVPVAKTEENLNKMVENPKNQILDG